MKPIITLILITVFLFTIYLIAFFLDNAYAESISDYNRIKLNRKHLLATSSIFLLTLSILLIILI